MGAWGQFKHGFCFEKQMERMKTSSFTTGLVVKNSKVLMLALSVVLVLVGCAPKRVIHGKTESKPIKQADITENTTLELPLPEAHGKVQYQEKHDPVEDLQLGMKAASLAQSQLDKPYQWGAQGPEKFDCSGLVYYIFGSLDIPMPRVSREQSKFGLMIKKSELQPGDLVFFITSGKDINHVGIYVGNSRFIHAPRRYSPVRYDSLNNSWWRQRFQFGRRISG